MNLLLIGLLVGALACTAIVFIQRQVCAEIIKRLESDRDLARNEAKVYRELLFPILKRAEAPSGGASTATTSAISTNGQTATVRDASPQAASGKKVRPRIPFRLLFNQRRAELNTKQKGTDALASALQKIGVDKQKIAEAKSFVEAPILGEQLCQ